MTKRIRELGVCLAYPKAEGSPYHLAISEFERLREDWMAGKAFCDAEMHYGGKVALRLADIVAIARVTPDSIATQRDDERADKAEDLIDGLDD